MTFKVGDRIRFKEEPRKRHADAYGLNHIVHSVEKSFPTGKFIIYVEGGKWAFYDEHFELQEPETPESKHKGLCTKITQLYERQEWVQSGKPEAIFSTRPPAPSVESKDGTGEGTTSESSLTDIVTALAVDIQRTERSHFDHVANQYRLLYQTEHGLRLYPNQLTDGSSNTTSR